MKTTSIKIIVATLALTCVLIFSNQSSAAVIPVDDWYASGNAATGAIINNGDTISPDYAAKNQSLSFLFSYFDPVTLSDGDILSLSFNFTLDLAGDATSKTFSALRFGLFNSSTPHANTASFGDDRVISSSTTVNNWPGFLLTEAPMLYRKSGIGGYNYASTGDISGSAALSGTYNRTFDEGVTYLFSLTFKRSGNNLLVSGSTGVGAFSSSYVNAFNVAGYNVFDAFGLYATATDGVVINSIQITNAQIVPEPSSLLLLTVGLIPLFRAMRRRR